ncbi:MAG TPA: TonB-dependent receptor [Myxococcales bacterium]|nr:TonB-dependent receptor [Myxococcales bacterium]
MSLGAWAQEGTAPAAPPAEAPAEAKPAAPPAGEKAAAKKPGEEEYVEEIVVTGSRIPRVELQTAAPVTVVNRAQIESSGRPSIGDILQTIPEQSNAINTSFNNGGDGATRINLRGLGTARTLVLLNGRRFVAGGTGADLSVDLNSIPSSAIQRIEVLKDGASAVYGSDAIAGVVNIITRKDFAGSEIYAYGGTSNYGDGTLVDLGGTTGQVTDKGNILFSGGFTKQQPAWAGDRSWSKYDETYDYYSGEVFTLGSSSIPQGRMFTAGTSGAGNQAWTDLRTKFPKSSSFTLDATTGAWRPYNGLGVADAGGDQYNYQPENYLVTPQQRGHLFAVGEYKFSPDVRGYFEASFTNRVSEQKLAPEPLFIDAFDAAVTVSAQNPYNPFNINFTNFRRRLVEFGNRTFREDVNTFRLVTGVTGSLPILSNWNWDVSLNLGRNDATLLKRGSLQLSLLGNATGPGYQDTTTGIYYCGTPGAEIAGCVPLNLFGGAANRTITPDMARYLSYDGTTLGSNQQFILSANLAGELFRITPNAHMSGFALGYEFRKEAGSNIPDPLTAKGDTTGNSSQATGGSFSVNEGYLELSVPVLGQLGEGAQGKDLLELQLAARFVNYSTFGSNLSYKAGVRISPIQDITLRGTYSTAFRAPAIAELYSGQFDDFPTASDPCSAAVEGDVRTQGNPLDAACDAAGVPDDLYDDRSQILTHEGGNPELRPETANIFTVGLVVEPRFLKDFSVTFDYYDINVANSITTIGVPLILQGCYPTQANQAPQYCDMIKRDPTSKLIGTILNPLTNVGGDHTSGLDIGARFEPETPAGRFLFDVDGAYTALFDTLLAGNKLVHGKGNYDLGVHPDWVGSAGITWALDPIRAGVRARFVGPYVECSASDGSDQGGSCYVDPTDATAVANPARTVQPYTQVDANVAWTLNSGLGTSTIAAGVNNIFNVEPAKVWNGFTANSDPSAYDYMGRYFYARVSHKF